MVSRLFLIYAVVELAVIIALVSTIGLGWTLLVLLATFVVGRLVGLAQFGWQLRAPAHAAAFRACHTAAER